MISTPLVRTTDGTTMGSESVPERRTASFGDRVRPDTSHSTVVVIVSIFVPSEEDVDALVGPVHVAGAVLEFLFSADRLLQVFEEAKESVDVLSSSHWRSVITNSGASTKSIVLCVCMH